MRAHLIVDLRDRTLFALRVAEDGAITPCAAEVAGRPARYLSTEVLLTSPAGLGSDLAWEELSDLLGTAKPANLFARTRRLGLRLPWTLEPGIEAIRLRHPLRVLSSFEAAARHPAGPLSTVAAALAGALLDPLFRDLQTSDVEPESTAVLVVVPAFLGRPARLILRQLFRARGFRRVELLPREVAAALALGEEPAPTGLLVLDVEEDDLQMHRVAAEPMAAGRIVRPLASAVVPGLGWSFWVEKAAAVLQMEGHLPSLSSREMAGIDRAWTGLAGGPWPAEIAEGLPLRLTHSLLHEIFAEKLTGGLIPELAARLGPALERLGWSGGPGIALGGACAVGGVQDLLAAAAGVRQPPSTVQIPPLERCARGVASTLAWLAESPDRRLAVQDGSGLRINTLGGETLELIPGGALPQVPGERRRFRRVLRLEGEARAEVAVAVQLLWGRCHEADGNAQIWSAPVEKGSSSRGLDLTLDVRRSRRGWAGTAEATFGGRPVAGALRLGERDLLLSSDGPLRASSFQESVDMHSPGEVNS